jgi:hypothetical protein
MAVQVKPKPPTEWNLVGRSTTAIACFIAQQYSSAVFVTLCSHPRKEKFSVRFKNLTISSF